MCLTDFEDSLLQNLEKSCQLNSDLECKLSVSKLDWMASTEEDVEMDQEDSYPTLDASETYPFVIGSDLMYEMKPSVALANVIQRHLDKDGTCLLAMKMRYEKILVSFLRRSEECDLSVYIKEVETDSQAGQHLDSTEDRSKLFGGGRHIIMLIHHKDWALTNFRVPKHFCSAGEFR